MKSSFLSPLLAYFLIAQGLFGQTETDQFFKDLIKSKDIPAISVVLIEDGEVVYNQAHGVRANDTQQPVNTQTVFSAASLSKQVFAYTVMKLVESGDFDLDKPLYQYLEYPDLEHDERYKSITGRMVLSHSTGMPNWRRGQLDLKFEPGAQFQYSGEGFVYLMKVIEHLQQKGINELSQELVFQPLDMTNSSFVWEERFDQNYAPPHDFMGTTLPKSRGTNGNVAYSLQTTAEDYAKLILAVLNANDLKKNTISKMLEKQTKIAETDALSWGLGWGLQQTQKGKAIWQWGDNGTFKAFTLSYPAEKKGMVFLTNSENGLRIVPSVVSYFFKDECPAFDWADYATEDRPHEALLKGILQDGYDQGIADYLHKNRIHHDTALISQNRMRWVGDRLLRYKRFEDAKKVFQSNLKAYESFNSYVQYAHACLRSGDQQEAKIHYGKAFVLNPKSRKVETVLAQLEPDHMEANVVFRLPQFSHRYANLITIAGDFNKWNSMTHPFVKQNGEWVCKLKLEPGIYQYKLVVDGMWTLDPNNPETALDEDNHVNSVLVVDGK